MSAAHDYMIKTLLKAFGIQLEDLQPENIIPKLMLAINVTPEQAQEIFARVRRIAIDYENNQAQNNLRMMAIMNHLGIVDPVLIAQLKPIDEDRDNGEDDSKNISNRDE